MSVRLSPLVRRCYHLSFLSPHVPSFCRVFSASVTRTFSVTSQVGERKPRTKTIPVAIDFTAFGRYLKGECNEPYGEQGKESRDRFVQTLTEAFESVAQQKRFLYANSSVPQMISAADFLVEVFTRILGQQPSNSVVHMSYLSWVVEFFNQHVMALKIQGSKVSMLREYNDTIETFLEDYLAGKDQTELKTLTSQIVNDIILSCMEEFLDDLAAKQALKRGGLPAGAPGSGHEGWQNLISTPDLQNSWKRPFRGKSLMLLKQKLALNVHAVQKSRRSRLKVSKLGMSRIIPIVQSSGTGKSRLSEEYVKDQFGMMLTLKNGHGFPACDKYVSEYFKDSLRLEERFAQDMAADPNHLATFDHRDTVTSIARFNDGFFTYHNPIYFGTWATQMPNMRSVPMPWAAAGRLRVACFLSSLFDVLATWMEVGRFDKLEHWQNNFLHGQDSSNKNRDQFWFQVIENSLAKLRENDCKLLKEWILYGQNEKTPTLTNDDINVAIQNILRPSMYKFFQSPVVTESLQQCTLEFHGDTWDLPFLFIIDEAAYLYQMSYMHSFMWVLDQPFVQLLYHEIQSPAARRFFVLMLGTHSQVSHFAPHYNFPSERYFTGKQHIPSVFSCLDWDSGVQAPSKPASFESSAEIGRLVRWGRPLWLSYYEACSNKTDHDRLKTCVTFAVKKLTQDVMLRSVDENHDAEPSERMSAFAALALRVHLDLDLAHPSRASKLVSSKMRWLVDVDPRRRRMTTTYGSEPLLVEAAAHLMNSYCLVPSWGNNPVAWFLRHLDADLNQGYVDRGRNGELTARLLLILAKDQATRQVWWEDKTFLTNIHDEDDPNRKYVRKDFQVGQELYFQESDSFYQNPCSSSAFYHRAVKVKDFFKTLFRPDVYGQLETHFKKQKKWNSLDNAYLNFTHFVPVNDDCDGFSFTKAGFFAAWQRHVGYCFIKENFPICDIVIPMAIRFRNIGNDTIDSDCMSAIIISIKNRDGNDLITEPFLPRECVEGVYGSKKENPIGGEGASEPPKITPVPSDVLLRLTLYKLKFVNPEGVAGSAHFPDDAWIQTTKDKPLIAFAMSLGDTDRKDDLFIGEENKSYNSDRIAFGTRGLTNTYNTYNYEIMNLIREISIRHDGSGRYPQSKADYILEKGVLDECRKPLDDLFAFATYWEDKDKKDADS